MSLESDVQEREAQIQNLDERWIRLMTTIRDSKERQKRNHAADRFAAEIRIALDENYSSTLDCILKCAERQA